MNQINELQHIGILLNECRLHIQACQRTAEALKNQRLIEAFEVLMDALEMADEENYNVFKELRDAE